MSDKPTALTSIIGRKNREHIHYNAYVATDYSREPLFVYQSGVKHKTVPGWISGPAVYDHYILHYIVGGEGVFYNESGSWPVHAGDAFIIRPYERVHYIASETDPWHYYWVGFNGTEADRLLMSCGYTETERVCHFTQAEKIIAVLAEIDATELVAPAQEYLLIGCLYRLFSILIGERKEERQQSYTDYAYTAARYIRAHFCEQSLSVQGVADAVGLSRSHLYRVFEKTMHISIKQFILSLRFEKARRLLTCTSHTISEVALNCGFSDPAHFSILFKQEEGMSPRDYRNAGLIPRSRR